jgi:molecular chaperone DnaK
VTTEVRGAVDELKTALAVTDADAVKAKMQHLSTVSQKIGQAIYAHSQSAGANPQPGSAGTGTSGSTAGDQEDVVDAEIVDEDEQK